MATKGVAPASVPAVGTSGSAVPGGGGGTDWEYGNFAGSSGVDDWECIDSDR